MMLKKCEKIGLTTGRITKAVGDDHIGDSNISDDGKTFDIDSFV